MCVDNFARYNHGDLVFGPEPVMVVSTDYGADMDSSDFASFAVYLDMTLALFGVDRYEYGLGIGSLLVCNCIELSLFFVFRYAFKYENRKKAKAREGMDITEADRNATAFQDLTDKQNIK